MVILVALLVPACTRDSEASLRVRLDQWFYLGSTVYFVSNRQCTGAMVSVNVSRPRRSIAVYDNVIAASYAFNNDRVVTVQVADASPAEVIDMMIQNGSSGFGRQALSAVALATSCFEDKLVGGFVHEALTRKGAILAFDRESRGLMVLDPSHDRLFFIGSDVW